MKLSLYLLFPILFLACSGLEKTEYDKIRKNNCSGDYIRREHKDSYDLERPLKQNPPPVYSWDQKNKSVS